MNRVVIADDHGFFRSGLAAALSASGFDVVDAVGTGVEALALVAKPDPDVVVLDVRMPEMDGATALQKMRAQGDQRPVIILATELDDRALISALEAGANAIFLKDGAESRIFDAIKAVADGSRMIQGELLDRAFAITKGGSSDQPGGKLTEREIKVANLAATGVSNREIGKKLGITEGTVKVNLHNIYKKLDLKNRTELAVWLRNREKSALS